MSRLQPRAVKEISTGDAGTDRVQEALAHALREVDACPLLHGVLISAKLRPSISEQIPHKLGRTPQGFVVVDLQGTSYGPTLRRRSWDARTITLEYGGASDLAVKVWVF